MTTDGSPRPQPVPTLVVLKSGMMLCGIAEDLVFPDVLVPVRLRFPARMGFLDLPGQSKVGSLQITTVLTCFVLACGDLRIQRDDIAVISTGPGVMFDEYLARTAAWRLGEAPRIIAS